MGEGLREVLAIPLTRGRVALVDRSDHAELSKFKWRAIRRGRVVYAARDERRADGTRTMVLMHRALLPDAEKVDHVNGNGLDNRRANLRPATHSQNQHNAQRRVNNTSGFIGVDWVKAAKGWRARVQVDGEAKHLGIYATPEEAARVRDRAARQLHGAFARLNFPTEGS